MRILRAHMDGNWEDVLAMTLAAGFMVIVAIALGQAVDVQAAYHDPSSEYYAGCETLTTPNGKTVEHCGVWNKSQPVPKIIDCDIKPGCIVWQRETK